jgi:hypothetical protein
MTLPTGTISMSQVNTELGLASTTLISLNQANVRTLAGVGGSGTIISMNDLRGKSAITLAFNNASNFDVEGLSNSIAFAGIALLANGSITYDFPNEPGNLGSGPTAYLSPLTANAGADYEARLSNYSVFINGSGTGTALNVAINGPVTNASTSYVAINQNRNIQIIPSQGDEMNMTFTLEIRKIGTTSPVISRNGFLLAAYQ